MILLLVPVLILTSRIDTVFTRTYGGALSDGGRSVVRYGSGFAIAGWTWSYGSGRSDVYVLRIDDNGDTLWTCAFGSFLSDVNASLVAVDSSLFISYTRSLGSGNADVALVKLDHNGSAEWERTYGSNTVDGCYSMIATDDSCLVIAGWTHAGTNGGSDVYLIKTDLEGDTVFTRTIGGVDDDYGYDVIMTSDSGLAVCGYSRSGSHGEYDFYTIRLDRTGGILWTQVAGGSQNDLGYSIAECSDGFLIAGATWSYGAGAPDQGNIYIAKFDHDGNFIDDRYYGDQGDDRAYRILPTANGNSTLTGSFDRSGNVDCILMEINALGDTVWSVYFGGQGIEQGFDLINLPDQGYAVCGATESFGAGSFDVYFIRLDSSAALIKEDLLDMMSLVVYPIPFQRQVMIRCTDAVHMPYISIYDITGRKIWDLDHYSIADINNGSAWSGENYSNRILPSGVYILRAEFEDRVMFRKLIKLN